MCIRDRHNTHHFIGFSDGTFRLSYDNALRIPESNMGKSFDLKKYKTIYVKTKTVLLLKYPNSLLFVSTVSGVNVYRYL